MRQLPKDSQKIIDGWRPETGIRERARSLGWVGPFEPDEWYLLGADCFDTALYLGRDDVSAERLAIRKSFDDEIDELTARRDSAQIAYDNAVGELRRRAEGQFAESGRRLQRGELLVIGMPTNGQVQRRLDILRDTIADLSDALARRDAADRAQFARESITGSAHAAATGPGRHDGPVLMSRGRRR